MKCPSQFSTVVVELCTPRFTASSRIQFVMLYVLCLLIVYSVSFAFKRQIKDRHLMSVARAEGSLRPFSLFVSADS